MSLSLPGERSRRLPQSAQKTRVPTFDIAICWCCPWRELADDDDDENGDDGRGKVFFFDRDTLDTGLAYLHIESQLDYISAYFFFWCMYSISAPQGITRRKCSSGLSEEVPVPT